LSLKIAERILGEQFKNKNELSEWMQTSWDDCREANENLEFRPRIINLLGRNPDEIDWEDPEIQALIDDLTPVIAESVEKTRSQDDNRDPNMLH
jgi:hypothetical protein